MSEQVKPSIEQLRGVQTARGQLLKAQWALEQANQAESIQDLRTLIWQQTASLFSGLHQWMEEASLGAEDREWVHATYSLLQQEYVQENAGMVSTVEACIDEIAGASSLAASCSERGELLEACSVSIRKLQSVLDRLFEDEVRVACLDPRQSRALQYLRSATRSGNAFVAAEAGCRCLDHTRHDAERARTRSQYLLEIIEAFAQATVIHRRASFARTSKATPEDEEIAIEHAKHAVDAAFRLRNFVAYLLASPQLLSHVSSEDQTRLQSLQAALGKEGGANAYQAAQKYLQDKYASTTASTHPSSTETVSAAGSPQPGASAVAPVPTVSPSSEEAAGGPTISQPPRSPRRGQRKQ